VRQNHRPLVERNLQKKLKKTQFLFGKQISDNFFGLFSDQSMELQLASAKYLKKMLAA
jgi:hypothetical protein